MDDRRPNVKPVILGRIAGAHGVKGAVRIMPFTRQPEDILHYENWLVGEEGNWACFSLRSGRMQGTSPVVEFDGVNDRDAALDLRGRQVAVPEEALPPAGEDEYYWKDLIGLEVVNQDGELYGRVSALLETGANDVMVIKGKREQLLPFVENVVKEVNLSTGRILVDWEADD